MLPIDDSAADSENAKTRNETIEIAKVSTNIPKKKSNFQISGEFQSPELASARIISLGHAAIVAPRITKPSA